MMALSLDLCPTVTDDNVEQRASDLVNATLVRLYYITLVCLAFFWKVRGKGGLFQVEELHFLVLHLLLFLIEFLYQ